MCVFVFFCLHVWLHVTPARGSSSPLFLPLLASPVFVTLALPSPLSPAPYLPPPHPTLSISSLLPSIHPSVSWQKMSHASSWEAKTLPLSLNISSLYFSSPVFLCLFLPPSPSLSPSLSALYRHLFLHVYLLCSVALSSFLSQFLSVSLKVRLISHLCFYLPLLSLQQGAQLFSHSLVSLPWRCEHILSSSLSPFIAHTLTCNMSICSYSPQCVLYVWCPLALRHQRHILIDCLYIVAIRIFMLSYLSLLWYLQYIERYWNSL